MTPREAAEAMREAAATLVEKKDYPYWGILSGLIRAPPLPEIEPISDEIVLKAASAFATHFRGEKQPLLDPAQAGALFAPSMRKAL